MGLTQIKSEDTSHPPAPSSEVSAHKQSDESEEISGSTAEKGIIHFKQPVAIWEVSIEAAGYAVEEFTVEHNADEPTKAIVESDPEDVEEAADKNDDGNDTEQEAGEEDEEDDETGD